MDTTRSAGKLIAVISVGLVLSSCTGSSNPKPNTTEAAACIAGTYCVNFSVTGDVKGTLITAKAPKNFQAQCTVTPKPKPAWVAHVFGGLDGATWLLSATTLPYSKPGTYSATITLGKLGQAATGVAAVKTYVGRGTVLVATGAIAASITANLRLQPSGQTIHIDGSLSCSRFTKQD